MQEKEINEIYERIFLLHATYMNDINLLLNSSFKSHCMEEAEKINKINLSIKLSRKIL